MKYVVDRVEDDKVVLQELKTGEMINIDIKELNFKVKDGDVLNYLDDKYELNIEEYEKRKESIALKFNQLKKKKGNKKDTL